MTAGEWVNETLYADWGQRFLGEARAGARASGLPGHPVFESHTHGRVMLLDGVVQITERDEFVYQEMLDPRARCWRHGAARSAVLIIGAGDGGVLKRVLQHRNVERA
jgi:spermidine synthase